MSTFEFICEHIKHAQCQRADRLSLVTLIRNIMALSQLARDEGILELEQFVYHPSIPFLLAKGLEYLVNGIDVKETIEILIYFTLSSDLKGRDLLESLLIIDGIRMIAQGYSPKNIRDRLVAMLGDQVSKQLVSNKLKNFWSESVYGISTEKWPYVHIPKTSEKKLLRTFHHSSIKTDLAIIQKANYADLLIFLLVAEKHIYKKFTQIMPPQLIKRLEEDLCSDFCPTVERVSVAIKRIMKISFENRIQDMW